jgi:formate hydrogenlyase subunit 4
MVGKLPYDTVMTEAMIHEQNVIEFSGGKLSHDIREMWSKIQEVL